METRIVQIMPVVPATLRLVTAYVALPRLGSHKKKEMFLDSQGFVNEVNKGKGDPVIAKFTLATVKDGGKTEKRIVNQRFEGVKKCPRYLEPE